ncbi:MAG: acetamidase/formamidase family protein [Hydrogenophaga sp.]|uniref:acetamidase/formamidase family protein n=1 Tax=Hydrogenophaga sp. TaxID=1904254 RepID=UPI0025B8149A|nr:acetamidase/formamidase family protein [Hydrogenophaga sp.]MBU7575643.1 acetamidase/formamidase family protein [Hydrogenophaga sp.]
MTLHLRSRPETVVWGFLAPDVPPVLRIASGTTVDIDTVNALCVPPDAPEAFFERHRLELTDAAQDICDIVKTVPKGVGPHVLTGPIHIEGAEPGDVLEVRIHEVEPRAPHYGVNFTRPGAGSLPDLLPAPRTQVLPIDMARRTARFREGLDIPLRPFMGILAVAPTSRVSSIPPGRFGGNIDLKHLVPGARLYLPVQVPGALFFTGDGHGVQGNGEVNLTALETSMATRLEFVLHPRRSLAWPMAETPSHYIVMGLDEDLDTAAADAVRRAVEVLQAFAGVDTGEAYALASLAVDFEVTQLVDGVKGIHGCIPKSLFTSAAEAWWGPVP